MISDEQPDASQLLSGAALGGLLGTAASFVATGHTDELAKTFSSVMKSGSSLVDSVTPAGIQDMKVGLPNF